MTEASPLTRTEPVIYDLGAPGRRGYTLPPLDVPERPLAELLPGVALRADVRLPEVNELEVVRHFVRLSHKNHAIDVGFYPLGSCTMKYNPKINEELARLPGIVGLHPYQPEAQLQGALALLWQLERLLCEIGGMDRATLQPPAGAQGEFTGLLIARAYHRSRGDRERDVVIVPDSSHGTNPATAARCGMRIVSIPSTARGRVDLAALRAAVQDDPEPAPVLALAARFEAELARWPADERAAFLRELGMPEPGLHRLVRAGYERLGLISFFTTNEKEAHAWTVPRGTRAPQAAGEVHSDMERGFIRAETLAWDDFLRAGSLKAARELGLVRSEGRDYTVQDGDILLFRFRV